MRYVWDSDKEATNLKRRGIDFATAAKVFADPNAITDYDADHSRDGEDRWTTIGLVGGVLILIRVTWTDRDGDETIRIISARLAGPKARALYQDG
ncbi:MAG: BrnT family toxin [Planctomycetes bacterium]|nr:BrnT family toxin [Planctomycetota bacterium]